MLLSSVGENGGNKPVEVKIVQMLLNDWLGANKRTLLKIDGIAGPLTIGAIRDYQQHSKIKTDGRVDPNGPTVRTLVNTHLSSIRKAMTRTHAGSQLLATAVPPKPVELRSRIPFGPDPASNYILGLRSLLSKSAGDNH